MRSRHRNGPGKWHRSTSIGMGSVALGSRGFSEDPVRGPQMYNSEYRNFSRSARGHVGYSKQLQLPPHPTSEIDIFVEAGKLAAEYLISVGLLPSNALSRKWQTYDMKQDNFRGIRPREVDQTCKEVLASSHFSLDGTMEINDECNSMGSSNTARRSTRAVSHHNFGRSKLWSDRNGDFPTLEDDAACAGHCDGKSLGIDGDAGAQTSSAILTKECNHLVETEPRLEKGSLADNACAKARSSVNEKDLQSNADKETVEDRKGSNVIDLEEKVDKQTQVVPSAREDLDSKMDMYSVMRHRFANVSSDLSSIVGKMLDMDPTNSNDEDNLLKIPQVLAMDMLIDGPAGISFSSQSHELKSLNSNLWKARIPEEKLGVTYDTREGLCSKSRSFPDIYILKDREVEKVLPEFQRSNSMYMERGEKRALVVNNDGREGKKGCREWASMETQSYGSLLCVNSQETQQDAQGRSTLCSENVILSIDQNNFPISLFPQAAESCQYTEEKQLFSGPFKTCDLNLIEASDGDENITENAKLESPIDVDLFMSNGYSHVSNKDIEVIDLENDTVHKEKTSTLQRRADTLFSGLDGFTNNVHSANEVPGPQNRYGLAISEFIGNDRPECSSLSTELNSLHNDLVLHKGKGILDDDHIYMSLGEIPFSFLKEWERPTHDYGKPV